MTTIAEEKAKREQDLRDAPSLVISARLEVIQKCELANELKAALGEGLNLAYHDIASFYGKQRAILRGLTTDRIMHFDLPDSSLWNSGTEFTFPSANRFGYEFFDTNGNPATINDASQYYLAKKQADSTLCTLQNEAKAFSCPVPLIDFSQVITKADGESLFFNFSLQKPPIPETIKILHDEIQIGGDDGSGNLTGNNLTSSTVNYESGEVHLEYTEAPVKDTLIRFVFDSFTNLEKFDTDYEQVDFSLDTKAYGQGLTLNLIRINEGVLSDRPALMDTMILRKKIDHQAVGTIRITCEGLTANGSWNHLTDNPESATLLDQVGFKELLGYLDPDQTNDLIRSANPYLVSTAKKIGDSYPDIETSPMFPCTNGEYTDKPAFKGNFIHFEEGQPKWEIHSDIKWQYGTKPAGYSENPYSSDGNTVQENPGTVLAALQAIMDFTDPGNNPIPVDGSGNAGNPSTFKTYTMGYQGSDIDYVHENLWTWNSGSANYVRSDNGRYTCYYNEVQALKDGQSGLTHLQVQCGWIVDPENTLSNSVETERQSTDNQFVSDTVTFKSALDTFLTDHDGFDPITTRPTYNTSWIAVLQAATDPDGYLIQATTRLADLDAVIGTPETSGYSKKIYDSCNAAVRKDIGYVRDVIDSLNSIADMYYLISQLQSEYAMYP